MTLQVNRQHFDNNETRYQILFWLLIGTLQVVVNTSSVIADYHRLSISLDWWKPLVWEISSQAVGILLIFAIVWFEKKLTEASVKPLGRVASHIGFSMLYSVSHVVGMVSLRKMSYAFMGEQYDFGVWSQELVYEYTKDAYSYLWIIIIIHAYRFIVSRLRGEAKVISTGEDTPAPDMPKRLLVKKIGKEFMIKVEDIEWIEASGNYMNLHIKERVYSLRETMNNLERKLDANQFVRIHRSTMVNLDRICEIKPLDSGDFDLSTHEGTVLRLSRRYRSAVQSAMRLD